MAPMTSSKRIACAAFGASLFAFLGPGFHYSGSPNVPAQELAVEAAGLGAVIGLVGIVLAVVALRRLAREENKAGTNWATAAAVISGIGVALWTVILLVKGLG